MLPSQRTVKSIHIISVKESPRKKEATISTIDFEKLLNGDIDFLGEPLPINSLVAENWKQLEIQIKSIHCAERMNTKVGKNKSKIF